MTRRSTGLDNSSTQGLTYQQVADELGYANRGTVYRLVQLALADHTTEAVETLQELEVARLDALQSGLWDRAMQGDLRAAHEVLRIRTVVLTAEELAALRL